MSLDIDFEIPLLHSTIALDRHTVMLAGGAKTTNGATSGEVFILDKQNQTLVKTGEFRQPRNSFCLVRLGDRLYAVGGGSDRKGRLSECESTLIVNRPFENGANWQVEAPCKIPCSSPCVTSFRDQFIIKFGGEMPVSYQESHVMEVYSLESRNWFIVNLIYSPLSSISAENLFQSFDSLSSTIGSAAVSLNNSEILIFGGLTTYDNQPSKNIFRVDLTHLSQNMLSMGVNIPQFLLTSEPSISSIPMASITDPLLHIDGSIHGLSRISLQGQGNLYNLAERSKFNLDSVRTN